MIVDGLKTAFSGIGKWKTLRRLRITVQGISLILFIFLLAYFPMTELFFRLNPFAGLSASIAGRSVLIYFWPALIVITATILFGRVWCGWICPLGTVLDIAGFRRKKISKHRTVPGGRGVESIAGGRGIESIAGGRNFLPDRNRITWLTNSTVRKYDTSLRKIKYILLIMTLVCAFFGNLTLLILEPVTIMTRTFTVGILPAINHIITEIELFLYNFEFLYDALDAVDSLIRGTIIPYNRIYFTQNIIILLIFLGIILLNLFAHRFWCRYLCPFGGFLAFISRFSLIKRQVTSGCSYCTSCTHTCNMDAIYSDNQNKSDRGECTLCFDCFTQCPKNGLYLSTRQEKKTAKGIQLSRKNFLISIGTAALGAGFLKGDIAGINPDTHLIRPPGITDEAVFLSRCIRCGQCIRICPTSGLQLSMFQAGISGVWTPRLMMRAGACDYTCNLCGRICPTGAIPNLSLIKKQQTSLGKAIINYGRCLEWADGADCLICREFCPLPVKAVERRERIETGDEGIQRIIHGPVVVAERCIGCGICENLCPVKGDAAIRVVRKET